MILQSYLLRPADEVCFPIKRQNYAQAVARAAKRAGVVHWTPNQIRHTVGTEVRKDFGLEATQVYLGHANADTTQIYAAKSRQLGKDVAKKIG